MGIERAAAAAAGAGVAGAARRAATPMRSCPAARRCRRRWSRCEALRAAGVVGADARRGATAGSMKSQFKRADASGARYALIFGADELAQGEVAVKALREPARRRSCCGRWPTWPAGPPSCER